MNSELENTQLLFDVVWERICSLTGWKNYGQLADLLGITSSSVSGAKKRGFISLEWVFKVAQSYNISTDWLATGKGEMKRDLVVYPLADGLKSADITGDPGEGFVKIPRYKVDASAGHGAVIHSEQIVDHLTFKADWVHNALGVPVASLALINVKGDSMEPTLANGDVILIDMSLNSFDDSAVYVLRINGTLLVKRVKRNLDGSVLVSSDNAVYPPDVIKGDLVDTLNVVGRVVWCGRRM